MAGDRTLRLGVIGLGRRWRRRYRPALAGLKSLFRVVAATDQVQQLAAREATREKWTTARGVVELVRHSGVDAVLLADPQWYGLWPLSVAAEHSKPVFCGVPTAEIGGQGAPGKAAAVMVDLPLRHSPLALSLVELCAGPLGPLARLLCTLVDPADDPDDNAAPETLFPADYLDFCLYVLGGAPRRFLATGLPDGSLVNLLVETTDGRALQMTRCRASGKGSCRLEMFSTGGRAVAELPRRLQWRSVEGSWSRRLPSGGSACRLLLREFHRRVLSKETMTPSLADAERVAQWQCLAVESWKTGLWTETGEGAPGV